MVASVTPQRATVDGMDADGYITTVAMVKRSGVSIYAIQRYWRKMRSEGRIDYKNVMVIGVDGRSQIKAAYRVRKTP